MDVRGPRQTPQQFQQFQQFQSFQQQQIPRLQQQAPQLQPTQPPQMNPSTVMRGSADLHHTEQYVQMFSQEHNIHPQPLRESDLVPGNVYFFVHKKTTFSKVVKKDFLDARGYKKSSGIMESRRRCEATGNIMFGGYNIRLYLQRYTYDSTTAVCTCFCIRLKGCCEQDKQERAKEDMPPTLPNEQWDEDGYFREFLVHVTNPCKGGKKGKLMANGIIAPVSPSVGTPGSTVDPQDPFGAGGAPNQQQSEQRGIQSMQALLEKQAQQNSQRQPFNQQGGGGTSNFHNNNNDNEQQLLPSLNNIQSMEGDSEAATGGAPDNELARLQSQFESQIQQLKRTQQQISMLSAQRTPTTQSSNNNNTAQQHSFGNTGQTPDLLGGISSVGTGAAAVGTLLKPEDTSQLLGSNNRQRPQQHPTVETSSAPASPTPVTGGRNNNHNPFSCLSSLPTPQFPQNNSFVQQTQQQPQHNKQGFNNGMTPMETNSQSISFPPPPNSNQSTQQTTNNSIFGTMAHTQPPASPQPLHTNTVQSNMQHILHHLQQVQVNSPAAPINSPVPGNQAGQPQTLQQQLAMQGVQQQQPPQAIHSPLPSPHSTGGTAHTLQQQLALQAAQQQQKPHQPMFGVSNRMQQGNQQHVQQPTQQSFNRQQQKPHTTNEMQQSLNAMFGQGGGQVRFMSQVDDSTLGIPRNKLPRQHTNDVLTSIKPTNDYDMHQNPQHTTLQATHLQQIHTATTDKNDAVFNWVSNTTEALHSGSNPPPEAPPQPPITPTNSQQGGSGLLGTPTHGGGGQQHHQHRGFGSAAPNITDLVGCQQQDTSNNGIRSSSGATADTNPATAKLLSTLDLADLPQQLSQISIEDDAFDTTALAFVYHNTPIAPAAPRTQQTTAAQQHTHHHHHQQQQQQDQQNHDFLGGASSSPGGGGGGGGGNLFPLGMTGKQESLDLSTMNFGDTPAMDIPQPTYQPVQSWDTAMPQASQDTQQQQQQQTHSGVGTGGGAGGQYTGNDPNTTTTGSNGPTTTTRPTTRLLTADIPNTSSSPQQQLPTSQGNTQAAHQQQVQPSTSTPTNHPQSNNSQFTQNHFTRDGTHTQQQQQQQQLKVDTQLNDGTTRSQQPQTQAQHINGPARLPSITNDITNTKNHHQQQQQQASQYQSGAGGGMLQIAPNGFTMSYITDPPPWNSNNMPSFSLPSFPREMSAEYDDVRFNPSNHAAAGFPRTHSEEMGVPNGYTGVGL